MRIARVLATATMIAACCAAAEAPEATRILLRVINRVSTRTAKAGDAVYMQTVTPIAAAGRIIIPAESYVLATIIGTRRSNRVRGRAELSLRIHTFTLPSGQVVTASPRVVSVDSNGGEQQVVGTQGVVTQGPDADRRAARTIRNGFLGYFGGAIVGGLAGVGGGAAGRGGIAGAGLGIGASVLARGPEVELSPGTTIDAVFTETVTIE